jgi:hypothetical protein
LVLLPSVVRLIDNKKRRQDLRKQTMTETIMMVKRTTDIKREERERGGKEEKKERGKVNWKGEIQHEKKR